MGPAQIGEGSTYYLQHLKALIFLFLILSFINIPVILGFVLNTNAPEINSMFNALSYFTIGNIGESSIGCSYSTLEVNQYSK